MRRRRVLRRRDCQKDGLASSETSSLECPELAAETFSDYFDKTYLTATLTTDEGTNRVLDPPLVKLYKQDFGQDFSRIHPISFVIWWRRKLFFWYNFLLLLPFIFLAYLACYWRVSTSCHWLCCFLLIVFLEGATATVTRPTARFLTSMAWLSILVLAAMLAGIFPKLFTLRAKQAHPLPRPSSREATVG